MSRSEAELWEGEINVTSKEQTRRNRTCRFALGELQQYAIKTTSGCPKAVPVMGSLQQGSFYAVEKKECLNCEFYDKDSDKESAYLKQEQVANEVRNEKRRKHTTKYIW